MGRHAERRRCIEHISTDKQTHHRMSRAQGTSDGPVGRQVQQSHGAKAADGAWGLTLCFLGNHCATNFSAILEKGVQKGIGSTQHTAPPRRRNQQREQKGGQAETSQKRSQHIATALLHEPTANSAVHEGCR
jgi:hypothetical protein